MISGPRVMMLNAFAASRSASMQETRQPVPALRRLVGVGRGADHDRLPLPGRLRQLPPQHLRDVRLDPDRAAVAVVEGPVGS